MAQPDNAADSDSEERGFESLWAGQKSSLLCNGDFLSIAKAMVYHHTVGVYIIAARRILSAAGCIYCFHNDDIQFLTELMIYKATP